jgi:signal transduction histidine kinase/CheY-like chemotaxis protein
MGESGQDAFGAAVRAAAVPSELFFQLAEMVEELRSIWADGSSDYNATLEVVCSRGAAMVGADAAFAFLQKSNDLQPVAFTGIPAPEAQRLRIALDDSQHPMIRAFRSRETQIATGDAAAPFGCASLLVEPILGADASLGVLVFTRRDAAHPFSATDRAAADVIARQASFGASMHRQSRELTLIYEVTRKITSSLKLEEVLDFIHEGISQILPTDNFYIALWDGGDEIRFEIEVEERKRLPKRKRKWVSGLTEYLLNTRRPLLIGSDFTGQRERLGIAVSGRNAKCWMGTPMVYRDKAVGVIALQSYERENAFDQAHLSVLENLAGQAAVAIENARLFQETRASLEQLQTAQQLLLQSEKLAAVGQLISGIAHELNNPLTGVVGWTQYLLSQPLSKDVARHLNTINEQALRASKIVQNLLTFSRQHKPEQRMVNLNEILDSTLALRSYELRVNNIVVERDYAAELPDVAVDPHQIQQVVLNLIINAEQAMLSQRGGGTLAIATRRDGPNIVISVQDDGPGIPHDMLNKIFDPFFTTKPIGVGTGLGLSISFGIIQQHGGRIWAESAPGSGAKFMIELPMSEMSAAPAPHAVLQAPKPASPEQPTVLVVDDEESVRDLLQIVLQDMSMHVEMASNGHEALNLASRRRFDLIVSDLKMPGLSGSEFYEKLHGSLGARTPRFMFVTGDVLSAETRDFLDSTNSQCVLKPFDLRDVRKTVTESLARRAHTAGAAD